MSDSDSDDSEIYDDDYWGCEEVSDTLGGYVALLACSKENISDLKLLLDNTKSLTEVSDAKGVTAPITLVWKKRPDMLDMLLSSGYFDVNRKRDGGITALHDACIIGHFESVRILLKHGADPNCVDFTGTTPLMYAAGYGNMTIVRALLVCGAIPFIENKFSASAMDIAKTNNRFRIFRTLSFHISQVMPNTILGRKMLEDSTLNTLH